MDREEMMIPIDMSQHDFRFRRRWFHLRNCCTFSTFLLPQYKKDKPWNILTIGVFEGAQEVWLMQNILCHPESRLFCIDPWAATTKLDRQFMEECRENALHNLKPWEDQVTLIRGFSQDVLKDAGENGGLLGIPNGAWDLIIIDGDHNADPVYQDAVGCLAMVKPGGWLLFDDVRNQVPKKDHVQAGLEHWLEDYGDMVDFVWSHRFCDCYEKL